MLPLLLGLGLLAGNQMIGRTIRDQRADDLASQMRGLLGTGPGPMGPPDEAGQMGHTGGTGLLADPKDIGRQLEFAAGVSGLRGQQGVGLNLLNAAFGRAQQEAERQQSGQQYAQQFQRQGEQFERSFGAGREDAAAQAERSDREFELRQREAQRQGQQWSADWGLKSRADARAEQALGLEKRAQDLRERPEPNAMPKLPAGWTYQAGPAGEAVAAPIPGTTDWSNGVAKAESLQSAESRIEGMIDLISGKETTTLSGRKVRLGGHGSELYGDTAAQYSVIRGQIISDVAKLRDMGVLQEGEQERIEKQLRDPTTFGAIFTGNDTTVKGYEELKKQFRDKREQHFKANPWLIPPVPKGYEPVRH